MNAFEVLIPITAILVGGTAVILPIAGLTARFAFKPLVEGLARLKEGSSGGARVALIEQRLALMEEQIHMLERDNQRLTEEVEFRRELQSPRY